MMAVLYVLSGIAVLSIAVALYYRFPLLGVASILAFLLSAWERPNPSALFSGLGLQVTAEDLLALVLLVCALLNLARREGIKVSAAVAWPSAIFVLTAVASAVQGTVQLGFGVALNEFRGTAYLCISVLWFVTLPFNNPAFQRALWKLYGATSLLLILLAAYHIATYGLGDSDSFVTVGDIQQTGRPLVAVQALVLAGFGLHHLWAWSRTLRTGQLILGCLSLGVVLLAQHRSVWSALLVAFVLMLALAPRVSRARLAVVASFVAVPIIGAFVLTSPTGRYGLSGILFESLSNTGTYVARTEAWETLIGRSLDEGIRSVVFGDPFGTGWARVDEKGEYVTYSPHNWLVVIYLRTGIVGTCAILALAYALGKSLLRRRDEFGVAGLTIVLVFSWAYVLTWLTAPLLGYIVAIAARTSVKDHDDPEDVLVQERPVARLYADGSG